MCQRLCYRALSQIERLHARFASGTAFHTPEARETPVTVTPAMTKKCVPTAAAAAPATTLESAPTSEAPAAPCAARGAETALAEARRAWLSSDGVSAVVLECTLPEPNGYHAPLDACARRFARRRNEAAGSVLHA